MAANSRLRQSSSQCRIAAVLPRNPRLTFPLPQRQATTVLRQQSPVPVPRGDNRFRVINIPVEAAQVKKREGERAEQDGSSQMQVAQVNKEEEETNLSDRSPHVDSMPSSFTHISLPMGLYFFFSLKFHEALYVKAVDLKTSLEIRGHNVFLYDSKVHGANFGHAVSKALARTNRMVSFVTHDPPYGVRTQNFGNKCMDSTYDELNYYHAYGKDVRPLKMYTGGRWPPTTMLADKHAGEEGYYLMKRVFLPNLSFYEVSTWDVEDVADFVCAL